MQVYFTILPLVFTFLFSILYTFPRGGIRLLAIACFFLFFHELRTEKLLALCLLILLKFIIVSSLITIYS